MGSAGQGLKHNNNFLIPDQAITLVVQIWMALYVLFEHISIFTQVHAQIVGDFTWVDL